MEVTISIPENVVARLSERALIVGEPLSTYTSRLVEHAVDGSPAEKHVPAIQGEYVRREITHAEFLDLGRHLLEKVRAGKKD